MIDIPAPSFQGERPMDDHPDPDLRTRPPVPAFKTQLPERPRPLVTRPRLLRLIVSPDEGEPRATFVCAPAGSGKTTLLADWVRSRPGLPDAAVAWVSLGARDNDPLVFWSSILLALERSGAWPDDAPLPVDLPAHGDRFAAAFTVAFHDALASASRTPVVLVLDDVHKLTDPAALAGLDLLLRNPPPALRLVLAARFEPAVALPRLRLEGRIRDVDGDALAFTAEEAEELLQGHDVTLSGSDLGRVLVATEGWAAGLRFAAMSLAGTDDPPGQVAAFGGDQRVVADYLEHEVLAGRDRRVRRFLLDTSVVEQVTVELARTLSGRDEAGALLDELERANSLVSRPGRDLYRYHPLLRQYLIWELDRDGPDTVRRLHAVAARWLAGRGDHLGAIRHAAEAADGNLLTRLLAADGLRLVTTGEGAQVRAAVVQAERLGAEVIGRPAVALVSAVAALDACDPVAAGRALAEVARPPVDGSGERQGDAPPGRAATPPAALTEAIAVQHARTVGDQGTASQLLDARHTEAGDPDLDLVAHLERGLAAYWVGRLDLAEQELQIALAIARAEQRSWMAMRALAALADVALAGSDLHAAGDRAAETLTIAAEHGWSDTPPAWHARLTEAWLAFHSLDDDAAERRLAELPDAVARAADPTLRLSARLLRTLARFAASPDRYGVLLSLHEIWQDVPPGQIQPQLAAVSLVSEQRIALAVGEIAHAAEVADRGAALLGETGEVALLRAMVQQARGRVQVARRALDLVLAGDREVLSPLTTVLAWLWEARLSDRDGDGDRAVAAVSRAVAAAAPLGLVRPLAWGGPEISDLLARAVGTLGHDEAFVETVRALTPVESEAATLLTTRELELLTELPAMRTVEEIASSMHVSMNTVKTHIRGIYRKLGVTNRRDAVLVARRRGLI
jgi:LuxR family maltose regulon positive regulatory protein